MPLLGFADGLRRSRILGLKISRHEMQDRRRFFAAWPPRARRSARTALTIWRSRAPTGRGGLSKTEWRKNWKAIPYAHVSPRPKSLIVTNKAAIAPASISPRRRTSGVPPTRTKINTPGTMKVRLEGNVVNALIRACRIFAVAPNMRSREQDSEPRQYPEYRADNRQEHQCRPYVGHLCQTTSRRIRRLFL